MARNQQFPKLRWRIPRAELRAIKCFEPNPTWAISPSRIRSRVRVQRRSPAKTRIAAASELAARSSPFSASVANGEVADALAADGGVLTPAPKPLRLVLRAIHLPICGSRQKWRGPGFERILDDEIGNVRIGAKHFIVRTPAWGDSPPEFWKLLVARHFRGSVKPPFNDSARLRAGLSRSFDAEVAC